MAGVPCYCAEGSLGRALGRCTKVDEGIPVSELVALTNQLALEAYYKALVNPADVVRVEHPRAGHTFPSANPGARACAVTESLFVGNCGFDCAANRILPLIPRIEARLLPLNPMGCWDWWGYEGTGYAVKSAPEIAAVRAMVGDRLGESP